MKSNKYIYFLIPILLWPILWSNRLVPYIPESLFFTASRPGWWSIFTTIFIFEWLVFLYIKRRIQFFENGWITIGLDWGWFYRNRKWLIPYVSFFFIAALVAPSLLYEGEIPGRGQIIPITATRASERFYFVIMSITAGVCEEITFRGVGLTVLKKLTRSSVVALLITSICFVFIHGPFMGWMWFSQYLFVGILFGLGFLLPKRPRLEILILIHFTVDACLAAFVP